MTSVKELLMCTSRLKNFNLNQHHKMPLPLVIVVTGENADVPNVVSIRACEKKNSFNLKLYGAISYVTLLHLTAQRNSHGLKIKHGLLLL